MFSLGILELIIVLVVGALVIGVPVVILVVLVMLLRKPSSAEQSPTYSELVTENKRLRDEIAALKNKQG